MNDFLIAVILGIVEGLTEFLPISSTGHLILVNQFISFSEEFTKMFDIVIQLGAILSVVVFFRERLFPFGKNKTNAQKKQIWDLWIKTIIGVLPAIFIGAIVGDYIEELLFNPVTVSLALLIGGIVIIMIENRKIHSKINTIAQLNYKTAFIIGIIQCLAMIPGTSRSAATIIGSMLLGTSRVVAAEFSFFLAIPTIAAASVYSLFKNAMILSFKEIQLLIVGFVVSFLVALVVIAGFMSFIKRKNFKPFGYYRIVLGLVVLLYFYFN